MIHEIGHSLGNGHHAQGAYNSGYFCHSYGHINEETKTSTIMAYRCEDAEEGCCRRVLVFSNLELPYDGVMMGNECVDFPMNGALGSCPINMPPIGEGNCSPADVGNRTVVNSTTRYKRLPTSIS